MLTARGPSTPHVAPILLLAVRASLNVNFLTQHWYLSQFNPATCRPALRESLVHASVRHAARLATNKLAALISVERDCFYLEISGCYASLCHATLQTRPMCGDRHRHASLSQYLSKKQFRKSC
ncbi:hypothetical protein BDY19DRAFT_384932 [Irpex rosettiformis]|uniref:Uncharacterized protein n=1 Tax=Irpex rosettiformis TaxID=378272 RepID=A0ACB8TVB4_9APHY|nr:hypothetical protein BDY19DRAFT_384932 [Irpex rosettiformis]